jgi:hypothetical protein
VWREVEDGSLVDDDVAHSHRLRDAAV